eukprot:2038345-Pleurochrysis_carterae.AAC.1
MCIIYASCTTLWHGGDMRFAICSTTYPNAVCNDNGITPVSLKSKELPLDCENLRNYTQYRAYEKSACAIATVQSLRAHVQNNLRARDRQFTRMHRYAKPVLMHTHDATRQTYLTQLFTND